MKITLIGLLLFVGLAAQAEKFKININATDLNLNQTKQTEGAFTKFEAQGFETDKVVGAPELPVKSWLVQGTPAQIKVKMQANKVQVFADTKPFPVQEQDCRCVTAKAKTFHTNLEQQLPQVSVTYIGAFRGAAISRVDVRLGKYNAQKNETQLITSADVNINTPIFIQPRLNDMKDYLIIAPANLVDGVTEFADWKRSQGYTVSVESIATPANDQNALKNLIKSYYTDKGADFVILVGDETALPMFKVSTSGSSQTPSDLKYFTMDGDTDYVPDMFTSRIVASTPEQVTAQLAKAIEFEKRTTDDATGFKRFVGIASNEGSNPSDNDYIKSMEEKFLSVEGNTIQHLWQNDRVNSNPATLNTAFGKGFAWLTYLGHGSGTSWPSLAQQYSVSNVRQISNKSVVKPIIIDVACQNGRLISGNLGSNFMKTDATTGAFGAAAYYGGSVNISWHPPAYYGAGNCL